jgi:hypothetical protein
MGLPRGQVRAAVGELRRSGGMGGIVVGTAGYLHLGPRLNRPRQLSFQADGAEPAIETVDSSGNGFGPEIAEVSRCIRSGAKGSPLAPLSDSVGILAALDRVREQQRTGHDRPAG